MSRRHEYHELTQIATFDLVQVIAKRFEMIGILPLSVARNFEITGEVALGILIIVYRQLLVELF